MNTIRKYAILTLALLATTTITPAQESADQPFDAMKHIETYNTALRELEINYVDSIDHPYLLKMALSSICYELDPYTQFIPEENNDVIQRLSSGQYGGIGSTIVKLDDYVYLTEPFYGMPAQANGLRAGDKIIAIDGKKVKGYESAKVSDLLRGAPGTEIEIEVERLGHKKHITRKFHRALVQMPTVPYHTMLTDKTGYIVINDFIDRTYEDFCAALRDLDKQNIENLIIDLRGNGGGIVSQAVKIASLFLPAESGIVEIKGKHPSSNRSYKTTSTPKYPDMRLIFLVDGGTASSSEILAGAMQDHDRAILIGSPTVGKGLVQSVRQLPYNSYIKLTTAKYYLPSGRCIQAIDYTQNDEHTPRAIPDSLTTEFETYNGRIVRDGSGLTPDSTIEEKALYNIAAYMLGDLIYFKYANLFVSKNQQIDKPDTFTLSDEQYKSFCDYVIAQNYTYTPISERYINSLRNIIKLENNESITQPLLDQLSNLLQPNVAQNLIRFRNDIAPLLEAEIIKRYYPQFGEYQYTVKNDKTISTAVEMVENENIYNNILNPK